MRAGQQVTIEGPTVEDMDYVFLHAGPRQQRFTLVNGLTVKAYLCAVNQTTVTLDGGGVHGKLPVTDIGAVTWETGQHVRRCECHRCKPL